MDDFLKEMTDVGRKMESLGWTTGTESNRQDAWYNWTSKGKALLPRFTSEIALAGDARQAFSRLEIFDLLEWVYRHNAREVRIYRLGGARERLDVVMTMPAGVYQHDRPA